MTQAEVETSSDFKRVVVDKDYSDYKSDPINLRRAYHLAVGLFHLRDWTFVEYSGEPGFAHKTLGDYQAYLEQQCKDFGYIRDLANAVKHSELDPAKKRSTQMVGLANTAVSSASFQAGSFQGSAFQTRTFIVSKVSSTDSVDFEQAADKDSRPKAGTNRTRPYGGILIHAIRRPTRGAP
jgi:hypothetical protein